MKVGTDFYNNLIYSLVQAGNGDLVVAGSVNKDYGYKLVMIKLNASNGNYISHRRFNESFNRNQSLDQVTAIADSPNLVAFMVGRNLGYTQRHGILVYNVHTQKMVNHTDYVIKSASGSANMVSRGGTIRYNSAKKELLLGLAIGASYDRWTDWIIQRVDFSSLAVRKSLRFGNINRDLSNVFTPGSGTTLQTTWLIQTLLPEQI